MGAPVDSNPRAPSPSDEQLLALVGAGDKDAYWLLYERYSPRVFGLALKLLRDRTDAEDALQEVMLHVWKKASTYNPALGSPATWVLLVARSRALDLARKRGRAWRLLDRDDDRAQHDDPINSDEPAHAPVRSERSAALGVAVAELPTEQRTVIELAFTHGLTREEIARSLSLPVGTVKTRVRAGIKRLGEALGAPRLAPEGGSP